MTCLMSKICVKADGCDIHVGTNIEKCSAFKEKQTNFSRITASPDALAELMQNCVNCDDCPITDKSACQYKFEKCKEAWVEWLEQESE